MARRPGWSQIYCINGCREGQTALIPIILEMHTKPTFSSLPAAVITTTRHTDRKSALMAELHLSLSCCSWLLSWLHTHCLKQNNHVSYTEGCCLYMQVNLWMQSWIINVAPRYYGQDIDKVMTWHLLLTQVTIADATTHTCLYIIKIPFSNSPIIMWQECCKSNN